MGWDGDGHGFSLSILKFGEGRDETRWGLRRAQRGLCICAARWLPHFGEGDEALNLVLGLQMDFNISLSAAQG